MNSFLFMIAALQLLYLVGVSYSLEYMLDLPSALESIYGNGLSFRNAAIEKQDSDLLQRPGDRVLDVFFGLSRDENILDRLTFPEFVTGYSDFTRRIVTDADLISRLSVDDVGYLGTILRMQNKMIEKRDNIPAINGSIDIPDTGSLNQTGREPMSQNCGNVGFEIQQMEEAMNCSGKIISKREFNDNRDKYVLCTDCRNATFTSTVVSTALPTLLPDSPGANCTSSCCLDAGIMNTTSCVCPGDRKGPTCLEQLPLTCDVKLLSPIACSSNKNFAEASQCPILTARQNQTIVLEYRITCFMKEIRPAGTFTYYYNSTDLLLSVNPQIGFFSRVVNFYQLTDFSQYEIMWNLTMPQITGMETIRSSVNVSRLLSLRVPKKKDYAAGNRLFFETFIFSSVLGMKFESSDFTSFFLNLEQVDPEVTFGPAYVPWGIWLFVALLVSTLMVLVVLYFTRPGLFKKKKTE